MKTFRILLALPLLASTPLAAQDRSDGPGNDLIELYERMRREGATENDLMRLQEERALEKTLLQDRPQPEHPTILRMPRPGDEATELEQRAWQLLNRELMPDQLQRREAAQRQMREMRPDGWFIGLVVEPVPPFVREHLGLGKGTGVRVSMVAEDSPAARAGIRVNDIVHSAAGKKVGSLEDLREIVSQAGKQGGPLKIGWIHQGQRKDAEIQPDGPPVERKDAGGRPSPDRRIEELSRLVKEQQREIRELHQELRKIRARLQQMDGE